MAVFTEVTWQEVEDFLSQLHLGALTELVGCEGGIENTNYFVTTSKGQYVLTIFERLEPHVLPFYLALMQHLVRYDVSAPDPMANDQGVLVHQLQGKPACVVTRLKGKSVMQPTEQHCSAVGAMLAKLHIAGMSFLRGMAHPRGLAWWNKTAPLVKPYLDAGQLQLLESELAHQNKIHEEAFFRKLRTGIIHADLFRDNVLFDEENRCSFFDFYFAGNGVWLFDLAVCLNDWCWDEAANRPDNVKAKAFLNAYEATCPLNAAECYYLPSMLRAAALRFWISRLWDYHLPREASLLKPHDPAHFERVLRFHLLNPNSVDLT